MMSIGLHCRLAGRPGRAAAVARFIDYVQSHSHVWLARRIDIARHWANTHPHRSAEPRPSALTEAAFVARFGGVFEHSEWIAQRAFASEFSHGHDTAPGLHALLTTVFRSASPEERLAVLKAHPDLAGKLAQAKRLTESSTQEQASAGLDALTDAERAQFEALNGLYVETFGFPFIIAVKDHSKDGILEAFRTRVKNDRETEFNTACRQVERIAFLRLQGMLPN